MGAGLVFLVLAMQVPARSGGWMPQYIPMPSMEECERVAPLLVADATRGFSFKLAVPQPFMSQQWGQGRPERQPREIDAAAGAQFARAECRAF